MKKRLGTALRVIVFAICVLGVIWFVDRALRLCALSETKNSFFDQTPDSIEVVYIGNCHAYSSLIPSVVEEMTGKRGFVLAGSDQQAELTYYYTELALKYQSPEYIVLELFPFLIYESYAADTGTALEAYFAAGMVDMPLADRMTYIDAMKENGRAWQYLLFPLAAFHDRWNGLENIGGGQTSEDNGWCLWGDGGSYLEDQEELVQLYETDKREKIDPEYLQYLYKIIELTDHANVQLIFVTAPYLEMTEQEAAQYNTLADIAEEYGIPYVNFAKNEKLMQTNFLRGNMSDENHVNREGAELISRQVGTVIYQLETDMQ